MQLHPHRTSFTKTLSHRLSSILPSAVSQFRWQKWLYALPVGPLGRIMQWCFLLLWAQGLKQASYADSGVMTGRILTVGNVSANEGGSAHLQCQLSSTTAQVNQVNWEQQDRQLAIYHSNLGWHISTPFKDRVTPGSGMSLILHSLTTNDTGEYFCTYYTFPDGIYKERLFLEVLTSGAEGNAESQFLWLGALAAMLVVICMGVVVVLTLARKSKSLRSHSVETGLRRMAPEQENRSPHDLSSPGSHVQAEATPVSLGREQGGDDYTELHDYFNVLSYRSLSFLAKTG